MLLVTGYSAVAGAGALNGGATIESDADDNKYSDCAIAGQADYIITEDRHFHILKRIPFPSITTLNIDEFLEVLQIS